MDEASEAEDFQSVGIKCRDALIALGKQYQQAEWFGDLQGRPKAADFKGWAAIDPLGEHVSTRRPRSVDSPRTHEQCVGDWLRPEGVLQPRSASSQPR